MTSSDRIVSGLEILEQARMGGPPRIAEHAAIAIDASRGPGKVGKGLRGSRFSEPQPQARHSNPHSTFQVQHRTATRDGGETVVRCGFTRSAQTSRDRLTGLRTAQRQPLNASASWVSRTLLPDGSRNPESMPYGIS